METATGVKNPRENWADEVIAAAMKTSFQEFEEDNKTDNEDDEGIVSDESPSASSSSSNDETLIHHSESSAEIIQKAADEKNSKLFKTKMAAAAAKREKVSPSSGNQVGRLFDALIVGSAFAKQPSSDMSSGKRLPYVEWQFNASLLLALVTLFYYISDSQR